MLKCFEKRKIIRFQALYRIVLTVRRVGLPKHTRTNSTERSECALHAKLRTCIEFQLWLIHAGSSCNLRDGRRRGGADLPAMPRGVGCHRPSGEGMPMRLSGTSSVRVRAAPGPEPQRVAPSRHEYMLTICHPPCARTGLSVVFASDT